MNINPLINFRNFRIDDFEDILNFCKLAPIGLYDAFNVTNRWHLAEFGTVESALAIGFMEVSFMFYPFSDLAADVVATPHWQHLLLNSHSRVNLVVRKSALVLNTS